jgi:glycosyltransferase involved in cell wall biosynthesis
MNMGTLYSRNIGILNSKGKYIMNLDNDDLFLDKDVFDVVYNEIENSKIDILGFGAVDSPNYNPLISQLYDDYFHSHKDGLIVYQPELTHFPYNKKNKFRPNDYHLWGRLVKSQLYIKTINNLGLTAMGEERNHCFLSWAEDTSMSIALFRNAESYKFIQKYGILHYISRQTASFTRRNDENFFGEIYCLDLMYDNTYNTVKSKSYVFEKAREMKGDKYYSIKNEKNVLFLKAVLTKIINCQYINERDKNYLIKLYKDILK